MTLTNAPSAPTQLGKTVLDELASLHANPGTEVSTVVNWLGDNLNNLHLAFTGRSGEPISTNRSHGANIISINQKPYAVVYAMFMYQNSSVLSPFDISEIAHKIPSIEVIQGAPNSISLEVELYFNLTKWTNLVPSLLYEKTHFALATPGDFHEGKKASLEEARLLLSHFYPDLRENDLTLAEDLGMLERIDLFKTLLDKKVASATINPLPDDIGY